MQIGDVFRNGAHVGTIKKLNDATYEFFYLQSYLNNEDALPISVQFPLRQEPYTSPELFPFFFNMLAEGNLREMQCRSMRIDEQDHFARLLRTTGNNTIGAITIRERGPHGLTAEDRFVQYGNEENES